MRMRAALACACFASLATWDSVAGAPAWPPPPAVESRMRELQLAIVDPDSTAPRREAAREELASLLKSPAGQARGRTRDERPARAAIEPFPSVVAPAPRAVPGVPPAGIAQVEVVEPSRRLALPPAGIAPLPATRFAIDPRTGGVLHEVPGGYIDPRTGALVPR